MSTPPSSPSPDAPSDDPAPRAPAPFDVDKVLKAGAYGAAITILFMMGALLTVLIVAAIPSVKKYGAGFLTGTVWQPNELRSPRYISADSAEIAKDANGEDIVDVSPPKFGALPMIYGTAVSSGIALIMAVPVSLGAAIFLVRIAPRLMVAPISFLIEFLAAIPSIAFGLWGILVLAPFMHDHAEPFLRDTIGRSWLFHGMFFDPSGVEYNSTGHNLFSGGLILGIMILPIITAISRDVLRNVPRAKIEATVALGSTWWQSSKEMLKYSRSGLFGAIMLGLARAAGETMAITKLIGNSQQIKASIFLPAETMSSLLASKFDGATDIERSALLEVALILLVMSLVFNVVARWLVVGKSGRSAAAA